MTFDRRFCEVIFDTLGHDDRLRRAYRVYLWRRALGFIYHPHSPRAPGAGRGGHEHRLLDEEPTAGGDRCSEAQATMAIEREPHWVAHEAHALASMSELGWASSVYPERAVCPETAVACFEPGSDVSPGADTSAHQLTARQAERALNPARRRPLPVAALRAVRARQPATPAPERPDPRQARGTFDPQALAIIGAAFDQAWEEVERYVEGHLRREAARLILANAILAKAADESPDVAALKGIGIHELVRRRYLPAAETPPQRVFRPSGKVSA
jgi:hypothetical protein